MKRALGPNFFSREPLNYETLKKRCSHFHGVGASNPGLIEDFIKANRILQEVAIKHKANGMLPNSRNGMNFLGVDLNVSGPKLERELWHFLQKHWRVSVASENVVKAYVLDSKRSTIGHQFHIVTDHFHHRLRDNLEATGSMASSPVQVFLRVLMQRNDYHNCFKLIDKTYNDPILMAAKKSHLMRQSINAFIGSIGFATLGTFATALYDSSMAFTAFITGLGISTTTFSVLAIAFALAKTDCVDRIAWRLYVPYFHRYLNREHSGVLNQIVTHFEENNDVNSKNYHLRQDYDTVVSEVNDEYELISPYNEEPCSPGNKDLAKKEAIIASGLLRSELSKRKFVWKPLKEDITILEFWKSKGKDYEWVEPDQDPAEIVFKSMIDKK